MLFHFHDGESDKNRRIVQRDSAIVVRGGVVGVPG